MAYLRTSAASVLLALLAACAAPDAQESMAAQSQTGSPPAAQPAPAPQPPAAPAPAQAAPAQDPMANVDRSCHTDADCAVKNIGNCCGYYPACVNKDSPTDPAAVQAQCKASGMMSVCGFREISSCRCNAGTCEAAGTGAAPAVQ